MPSQIPRVVVRKWSAIKKDGTGGWGVEALQEADTGRLAAPSLANKGNLLARRSIEAEPEQDLFLPFGRVCETHILKHYVSTKSRRLELVVVVILARLDPGDNVVIDVGQSQLIVTCTAETKGIRTWVWSLGAKRRG